MSARPTPVPSRRSPHPAGPSQRIRRRISGRASAAAYGACEPAPSNGKNGWHPPAQGSPLSPGHFAHILEWGLGARPFYEGQALLLARVPAIENLWIVQFPGGRPIERFVFAEFQHPFALEIVQTWWRATVGPDIANELEDLAR